MVTHVAILGAPRQSLGGNPQAGHPGGSPQGPHGPPVAVLTEWGPPSVRWQPLTGGSIYKIDAPASHSYHLLWEAHSDARLPDQPYNLSTQENSGKDSI